MKIIRKYLFIVIFGLIWGFSVSGCANPLEPTATTTIFNPTPAGSADSQVNAVDKPDQESSSIKTETSNGDSISGEKAFNDNGCSACHSTGSDKIVGPGLAGVSQRAESRVTGQTAEEYIRNSIRNPNDYIVEGFASNVMIAFEDLSDSEIDDLIAYLRTLK